MPKKETQRAFETRKSRVTKPQAPDAPSAAELQGRQGGFADSVYKLVKQIPRGSVATYGQIAGLLGNRGMARAVGNALHRNPQPGIIPCHRVVAQGGRLSANFAFGGPFGQKERLTAEGVEIADGRGNMKKHGWIPEPPERDS
ncbi:MAG: MGMT family protein [Clostridia bacterium]|nr:MGMT family protein [Clostridia bacterium]